MTHNGSPKKVVFGPDSVEITYISTKKIIEKGVTIHASKTYVFSHFMPYSDSVQTQLPFEADKGIESPLFSFTDTNLLSNISNSDDEEYQHDLDIVSQEDLDIDLSSIPSQNPK